MVQTDKSGRIVKAQEREQKKLSMAAHLVKLEPEVLKAVPSHLDGKRMSRMYLTALRDTPLLGRCTVPSFLGSVLQLAQLGLEANTPMQHAYLIPYKNGDTYECKIMLGYPGMIEIAYRSGKVAAIYAEVVHEGDEFDYDLGLNRDLKHKPTGDEEAPMTHCYAVAELTNGHKAFVVLTAKQVEKRRKSARGADKRSSPWVSHPEEMWKKTAVRQLFKYLPKSAELSQAAVIDTATELSDVKQVEVLDPSVTETLRANAIDINDESTPEEEDWA